jgi:hypothetical protein
LQREQRHRAEAERAILQREADGGLRLAVGAGLLQRLRSGACDEGAVGRDEAVADQDLDRIAEAGRGDRSGAFNGA